MAADGYAVTSAMGAELSEHGAAETSVETPGADAVASVPESNDETGGGKGNTKGVKRQKRGSNDETGGGKGNTKANPQKVKGKKVNERQERELKLQVGIVLYFIDHRFAAPGLGWRHTAVVLEGIHPPRTTAGGGPSNPSKPFHDHNARRGP